ncbi:MAG: DNA-binding response regulator [Acidimicrobiia bacterium]|nr:DNA-binding response regulator [Acidimicrobiia bacterium]
MQVAVHPADCSDELVAAMAIIGIAVVPIEDLTDPTISNRLVDTTALVVELGDHPKRTLREVEPVVADVGIPVLAVLADPLQFPLIENTELVADFVTFPPKPGELGLRIRRLSRENPAEDVLYFKSLSLNPLTYQASLEDVPLDLTYMEYELLRFFVENQGRVWSREQLLSKVWGYDYYGGARTVDVHVRRLRAKLGDSRSAWITTVRSVGYRFG